MIYERIKEICKAKGITVRKLEQDLEFGRGSVRKFDQHDPSVGKMHMVAGYLGVTVDDLLDDKYESNKGPDAKCMRSKSKLCRRNRKRRPEQTRKRWKRCGHFLKWI